MFYALISELMPNTTRGQFRIEFIRHFYLHSSQIPHQQKEPAGWQAPYSLVGFEDFASFLELLQLTAGQFEFFLSPGHVVSQTVDLVEDHIHRGLLLPRLTRFLT